MRPSAELVKQFYYDNLSNLNKDKQFHFSSRLAAWEGDSKAYGILKNLEGYMSPTGKETVRTLLTILIDKPQSGKRNAHALRQPYFDRYPHLWGAHTALFRVRHLKFVYGLDCFDVLLDLIGKHNMDELAEDLLNDDEALRILSTFAVNYLYLYKFILSEDRHFIKPEHFVEVSKKYNLKDSAHLQLIIYLFTHCIIGESNFYVNKVSRKNIKTYIEMLGVLEKIITEQFKNINLDNKLEFLVCCRICDYETELFKSIWDECQSSISPNGNFLIDRHNKNIQKNRLSFDRSEHRNVLYIMSASKYNPHSTLVKA